MPGTGFAPVNFWHGKNRRHSGFQSDLSKVFKEGDTSTTAGLPYFNPHSFRNTLAQLGQELCKTPEECKAWSQNLGHEKVLTTFLSYGEVAYQRQGEIIRELATPQKNMPTDASEIAEAFLKIKQGWDRSLKKVIWCWNRLDVLYETGLKSCDI